MASCIVAMSVILGRNGHTVHAVWAKPLTEISAFRLLLNYRPNFYFRSNRSSLKNCLMAELLIDDQNQTRRSCERGWVVRANSFQYANLAIIEDGNGNHTHVAFRRVSNAVVNWVTGRERAPCDRLFVFRCSLRRGKSLSSVTGHRTFFHGAARAGRFGASFHG